MGAYLRAKFEISSIVLTGFRKDWGRGGNSCPLPQPQNEPLKSPPRLGLMSALVSLIPGKLVLLA